MSGQVLKFLQIICDVDDFDRVHNLGKKYCEKSIKFFRSLENYNVVKGDETIQFNKSEGYAKILEKIAAVEKSREVIDEMFSINNDVEKLKIMINRKMLVPSAKDNNENTALKEALATIEKAKDYVSIVGKEKNLLSSRFEVVKLKEITERVKNKNSASGDAESMAGLIKSINALIENGSAISVSKMENQIEYAEMVMPMMKTIDEKLYDKKNFPRTELVYSLLEAKDEKFGYIDQKATVLYKFICEEVYNFLKEVKKNCDDIETDKQIRLNKEVEKIESNFQTQSFAIKNDYKGFAALTEGRTRLNNLKNERKEKLEELKVSIDKMVEKDKQLKDNNMKVVCGIDEILVKNIAGYKSIMQ